MGPPDALARLEILVRPAAVRSTRARRHVARAQEHWRARMPGWGDDVDVDTLVARTAGFSGADLAQLCRQAANAALAEWLPDASADALLDAAARLAATADLPVRCAASAAPPHAAHVPRSQSIRMQHFAAALRAGSSVGADSIAALKAWGSGRSRLA